MDQNQLHALEAVCTQEEPAGCKAGCPLHVDGRALAAAVAKGNWAQGWKVLNKSMPFPGILGRLCSGSCMGYCKRGEVGDPINLPGLETVVVSHPAPKRRLLPMPAKSKKIAVVGAGLAALAAVWDLGHKGYLVTLFMEEESLEDALKKQYPGKLPEKVVATEAEIFPKLKVIIEQQSNLESVDFYNEIIARYDAVCLCFDSVSNVKWPLPKNTDGGMELNPETSETGLEKVFACPDHELPEFKAFNGRAAALSMDRLCQGVSLTAVREKQGPYETTLHVVTEGVEPAKAVPMPKTGYDEDTAQQEAARCLDCQCMECVKACEYLKEYKGYPKVYARQIYNNMSIVKGTRKSNKMINSCMLCGQCEEICPNGFSMTNLCLETRRDLVKGDIMPPSAHDFALEDLRFNTGPEFSLVRHAPGRDKSEYVFFPGCQLSGSTPEHAKKTYSWLLENLSPETGFMLFCCGAPAYWSGREDLFQQTLDKLREQLKELGSPKLVVACSTCLSVFKEHAPDLEVVSMWEVMSGHDLGKAGLEGPVAIHDPCTSRHDEPTRKAVRTILDGLGVEVQEMDMSGEVTSCCGYGGLLYNANPPLARKVAEKRVSETEVDMLAYCAMCRDNFAMTGKTVFHLLDLAFPESAGQNPGKRANPGFSLRHENRRALRRELLETLWKQEPDPMNDYEFIDIKIIPEVLAACEERFIMKEDIQKVIHHCLDTGRMFKNKENGRFLAYYKPVRVTYWVEFQEDESGDGQKSYTVYNAYSHRMIIPGDA